MKYNGNKVENVKIAYIGGGSRNWAWILMSDLAGNENLSGDVYLYDVDMEAAEHNEIIGNKFSALPEAKSVWNYHAAKTEKEAYENADFVVISILPGTFDDMDSDVHLPEKYGIYQSVGDTSGPGGIVRAMRTMPMIERIAECVKQYCPTAWVINYTNPMTMCVKTLYRVFPEIKAFGCCHEVFGTQRLLKCALEEHLGVTDIPREEIKVNPVSVNHFTWLTEAKYKNIDLFPIYREFAKKYYDTGYTANLPENWRENPFACSNRVKFDLFFKYGYIAAAGDRHLAEFCEGKWYLETPEKVIDWGFALTPVARRKKSLEERKTRSLKYRTGEATPKIVPSGEEGVDQMSALLGVKTLVTNVNLPNRGQIPNLPLGAVVETNAVFRDGSLTPVMAGEIPAEIYPMVSRICGQQEMLNKAIAARDVEAIFNVFANDPLVTCSPADARKLFGEMLHNTEKYLTMYDLSNF